MNKVLNAKTRQLIYGLSGVLKIASLTYFGVTEETWAIVTTTVLGVFDVALAYVNVNPDEDGEI